MMGVDAAPASTGSQADARRAALGALAALPPFEPVPSVDYQSQGRLLMVAERADRLDAVLALKDTLSPSLLWTHATARAPDLDVECVASPLLGLSGYLGAFELSFRDAAGVTQVAPFDLVLDLRERPAFEAAQPPQGYYHAPDAARFDAALGELPGLVGEFEKPKFFTYKASICAHSRSKKPGCSRCIDVCSTHAIRSAGDGVEVDPHLCMGCGACATVCPSGAMSYQYPRVADRGAQLRALLGAWRQAGKGAAGAPVVLFHNGEEGQAVVERGLPEHVLPISAWHVASIGLDVLLGAIAYGAGHVAVLAAGRETPAYRGALQKAMDLGQRLLSGFGFEGRHFSLLTDPAAIGAVAVGEAVRVPAGFHLSNDKRSTLEFCVEHLHAQGRVKPTVIDLAPGSPFGAITVDAKKCTLCMACVGACPTSALMDGGERPALKFLERNCVQCGLCASTCPEWAITLVPRLTLDASRRTERVLNESEPFHCVSCGKVLGTKQIVDAMLGRLAGHSMFQAEGALKRLTMCADCRVVDMMNNPNEVSILTGKPMP